MSEPVTVNFFEGKQKTLWLTALVLSLVLAVAGGLTAYLLPVGLAIQIVLIVVAVAGAGILLICVTTAKMRTSKWIADENGIRYYAFGMHLQTLAWAEMKEAGFLKITDPRRQVTAYYLYWTTEELMSACRNFIKGGVMEHKKRNLGKYNCRKGTIILYALDPYDPAHDPLLTYTQEAYPRQLKNPKVLNWATEAAQEE